MSAQPVDDERGSAVDAVRARLRLVPVLRPSVSTFGFFGIVACLVALGMGLVMVVSTSVTAQSKDLTALHKEATELGYQAAALTTELQRKSSSGSLALRAADLGMVPNPYPAFIQLSDGRILGTPTKVVGTEMPFLKPQQKPTSVVPQPVVVAGQTPAPTAAATAQATVPAVADAAVEPVGQSSVAPTTPGDQP